MQGAFILDFHTTAVVSGNTFAFGAYFLPIIIYGPIPKNWPPKKVFRGHFGPQVKFSGWNIVYTLACNFPQYSNKKTKDT